MHYNLNLPNTLDDILNNEFWVMEHVSADMFKAMTGPVKFAANVSIYFSKGECDAEINLIPHHLKAPYIINFGEHDILKIKNVADDFDASFVVISKRLVDNMYMFLTNPRIYSMIGSHKIIPVQPEVTGPLEHLYSELVKIKADTKATNRYEAVLYTLMSFFFYYGMKLFETFKSDIPNERGRIADKFLRLVTDNFRQERFLQFYADQLQVSPKHLAKVVKEQTGYTPTEWVERFIIIEAQILLRNSDMQIQEITDALNFPTQSSFGKYFKKVTGLSPREFRNSH